ncbi:hypothetical protein MSAN_01113700 [Mycena sanguinolenta]|uniref:Uncharacterized protein n=1 Tax=Mycena sanguinolenta TaxID=230812 RepID=A0A8H6YGL4_9AGAR|nr:hypothetical protein MSAN_01113700 [Mycena sanguinolenta]
MASDGPRFPPELEREIFIMASIMYPHSIPHFLQVAHRVLIWTEPFMYRVLRINKDRPSGSLNRARAILRAFRLKSKPAAFFDSAVRHLVLEDKTAWSWRATMDLLELSSGLVDFAALGDSADPILLPKLAGMHLKRIAGNLMRLFGGAIDLCHPSFIFITHLDVFDRISDGETQICSQIPLLPALTHLSFHNDAVPWITMERFLVECLKLEVLVNLWHRTKQRYAHEKTATVPIHDVRLVLYLYNDYWDEWEADARNLRPNFWSLADDFVGRKRNGLINVHQYWLSS